MEKRYYCIAWAARRDNQFRDPAKAEGDEKNYFSGLNVPRDLEVIAAGIGRPSRHLPPRVAEWLIERDMLYSPGLVALAAASVRRVGDFSELRQVIDHSGYLPSWLSGVENLYCRLQTR